MIVFLLSILLIFTFNYMKRILLLLSLTFFIVSCSKEHKVDGRDEMSFTETVDEVAKDLPLLQQTKFKEALDIIFEYRTNPSNKNEDRWSAVRNLVDDKTANEIFDIAENIAVQNNFSWNRNQVPLANGIPKPTDVIPTDENVETKDGSNEVYRFDYRSKEESEGIRLDPFFFNEEGQEIQLQKPITASVEIFSGGQLVYTQRSTIDPNSLDALYRNNGILIKYASLNSSKIVGSNVDVLVRIPNPDRYLTQRKSIHIPDQYVGGVGETKIDSVSKVINKDVTMITNLTNRFMQNLSKKNYSAAYALTRNQDWATYQKFSEDTFVTSLENIKVKETKVLDGDDKAVVVESLVNTSNDISKKYIITLEHLNNKWFIVNIK